jgi:hypothetical protein
MFHEKARKNFISKSEELLLLMRKYEMEKNEYDQINDDIYVSHEIKHDDIIGEIKFGITNGFGDDLGKYFKHKNECWGIFLDDYKKLKEIAFNIFRIDSIKKRTSYVFVIEQLFDWARLRFLGEIKQDFCKFFEEKMSKVVKNYEVWIPIPYTRIVTPIRIGNIDFKNIQKSFFEDKFNIMNEIEDEIQRVKLIEYQNKLREDFQGYMVGVLNVTAELTRAKELAYEEVSISLGILRTFSESNFVIEKHNLTHEYAHKTARVKKNFVYDLEADTIAYNEAMIDGDVRWVIDSEVFGFLKKQIDIINPILLSTQKTEFQNKVIDSLMTYSKNILRFDLSDRIMYILVALESLLLRNDSEPIQQNIGERLAFAIGKNIEDRIKIIKNVRAVYSYRSKFVHHGIELDNEIQDIRDFMLNVWFFIQSLYSVINVFPSKEWNVNTLLDNFLKV